MNTEQTYAPPVISPSTATFQNIRAAVGQVFVGQDEVVHQVLAALLAVTRCAALRADVGAAGIGSPCVVASGDLQRGNVEGGP